MHALYVLVADKSRARIFRQQHPNAPLDEEQDFVCPAAHMREHELGTSAPGRSFDSRGKGRHAMEPETSFNEHEAQTFARDICQHLNDALTRHRFDELVLIAPPDFLGMLREHLHHNTARTVSRSISKNLSRATVSQISATLNEK